MAPKKEHLEDRIDKLEDDRFITLCRNVDELHKLLVGNGKQGLIEKVSINATRIKLITAILLIILTAVVGVNFKTNADIQKVAEKINIEDIVEALNK